MTVVLYSTAGTFTWICPASVTSIAVECVGGGGGGGTRTTNGGGGGGGGGAYAKVNAFTVTPGASYTVVVGAAGTPGGAAGDSTFNSTTCVAKAGTSTASNTATGSAGGLASGCTGDIKRDGGSGWTSDGSAGGGGGSSAGIDAAGVTATSATGAAAVVAGGIGGNGRSGTQGNGSAPASGWGGGGGGGYRTSSSTRSGGNGAAGMVRITYAPYAMTDFWGCGAWYDPSDTSSVTLVSGLCSQINDKSGAGLHLTQGTAGSRPAMSTLNGRQCFDVSGGTTIYMNRASVPVANIFAANGTDISVFIAGKWRSAQDNATISWFGDAGKRMLVHTYYTGGQTYFDMGNASTARVSAASPSTNTNVVFSVVRSGAQMDAYSNGSAFASRSDASGTATGTNEIGLFRVDGSTKTPDALVGEIIIFTRPLSTAERQTIESYLTTKWFTGTSDTIQPHNRRGGFRGLIVR